MPRVTKFQILKIVTVSILLIDLILIIKKSGLIENLEHNLSWEIYGLKYFNSIILGRHLPVRPNSSYTIALIGDSMTDALRSQENTFKSYLKSLYKGKEFVIYNYGFGSTNILSLEDRLHKNISYNGQTYKAILGEDYNLIIIESFGNNPLSEYPIDTGLKKQNETLDEIIAELKASRPQSLIVFLATIAPSKTHYAEGVVELDAAAREKWALERESYILNHIEYAKSHKIPLINVFEKSVDSAGGGNLKLLSEKDHIHPSEAGVSLINLEMANYIFKMRLLPI